MLILTRRIGETLIIEPSSNVDLNMTLGELFAHGPLVVALLGTKGNQSRIGIDAPDALKVLRSELVGRSNRLDP